MEKYNKIYVSYYEIDCYIRILIDKIILYNIQFDYIYGIPKGGLPICVHMCNYLNLKYTHTIKDINDNLKDCKLLIVDDISDTGDTFINVLSKIKRQENNLKIATASIFVKPKSDHIPSFFANFCDNKDWIVFPWERKDSKTSLDKTIIT